VNNPGRPFAAIAITLSEEATVARDQELREDVNMPEDAATEMKARLRADLLTAMKDRNALDAKVIRSLVAALDNAEAPAVTQERAAPAHHEFAQGSAEVERLRLTRSQVHDVLRRELQERERAAAEFERLSRHDHAAALREEASVIRRYLT
jgi:uncharacterized protein YqeY